MKKEQQPLVFIPSSASLHKDCILNGDIILGDLTTINKNTIINTSQNTIIIGACVTINEEVKITSYGDDGYTFICNNVEIKASAQICNSTIEDGVQIKEDAVIMNGCFISKGAIIGERTILTPFSRVASNQICEANSVYAGDPATKIGSLDVSRLNVKKKLNNSNFSMML